MDEVKRRCLYLGLLSVGMAVLVALVAVRLAEAQEALPLETSIPAATPKVAAPRFCQVILRARATAELRPDLPWLEDHEAAAALDLVELRRDDPSFVGLTEDQWLWRVLLRGERCDGLDRRQGYVAMARDFTPAAYPGLAEHAWEMEVERRVVRDGKEVVERRAVRLDEVDGKLDVMVIGAMPRLVGGFSGVEMEDKR